MDELQAAMCRRVGAEFRASEPKLKVGLALDSLGTQPINGLRHPPEGETTGWYIWCGVDLSSEPDFFQSVHAEHLTELLSRVCPYLGLAPGWRFLIAEDVEDVWFDPSLL